ncbi:hypothetical protein [Marinobacter sp.]|uniref:hypothetical protein n=1 Tax=Marinobacter sp. TaxID=50741 RepID=UPI000C67EA4D|nr:hypothetical protein [Marinobacter sp.]MAO13721.1 hypothetical protein [Marinobacter sp.]|tara:strand:+ start:15 stop:431 length:417 start_codon:yes stop_codon:yes gene_type:complete
MAKDRRAKLKGRRGTATFLHIPHDVLNSDAYASLPPSAVKLLVDIASQFNGYNNGDLCATLSVLRAKGWTSSGGLNKQLKALLNAGLIEQTRQGGRNKCSLYAVTWRAIDECKGKLDVNPTKAPSSLYRQMPGQQLEN